MRQSWAFAMLLALIATPPAAAATPEVFAAARAQLAFDYPAGERELLALIASPPTDPAARREAFAAAVDLAQAAQGNGRWRVAERAVEAAARLADAAPGTEPRLEQGLLRLSEAGNALAQRSRARATRAVDEALTLLAPYAPETIGPSLSLGQLAFARALAIRTALITSLGVPPARLSAITSPSDPLRPRRCAMRASLDAPRLRTDVAAIVRARTDSGGRVIDVDLIAVLGDDRAASAIERALPALRIDRREDAEPGCRMISDLWLLPIVVQR